MNNDIKPVNISQGWDTFWNGVNSAAFSSNGVNHPSLLSFWSDFFKSHYNSSPLNVVDIACGNGALYSIAKEVLPVNFHCIDTSLHAIQSINQHHPEVQTLVADVSAIPLADNQGDLVVSQFGIEYASDTAILEACRLTKLNGQIALIMHADDSLIYTESSANLHVINAIKQTNIFYITQHFFTSIHQSLNNKYKSTVNSKDFSTCMKQLETLLSEHGIDCAAGLTYKIYNDIADIYENIKNYDINELNEWLSKLTFEVNAYQCRMQSMLDAAKSLSEITKLKQQLITSGMKITISDKLYPPNSDRPLCWIIIATKVRGIQ